MLRGVIIVGLYPVLRLPTTLCHPAHLKFEIRILNLFDSIAKKDGRVAQLLRCIGLRRLVLDLIYLHFKWLFMD